MKNKQAKTNPLEQPSESVQVILDFLKNHKHKVDMKCECENFIVEEETIIL